MYLKKGKEIRGMSSKSRLGDIMRRTQVVAWYYEWILCIRGKCNKRFLRIPNFVGSDVVLGWCSDSGFDPVGSGNIIFIAG